MQQHETMSTIHMTPFHSTLITLYYAHVRHVTSVGFEHSVCHESRLTSASCAQVYELS